MSVALLCPTRKRPEQLNRMIASVMRTQAGFPMCKFYIAMAPEEQSNLSHTYAMPDGMPTAHKWNRLAEIAMSDPDNKLFMLAADDMIFSTPLWDEALLNHYNALENKIHVYALQDSRDENGTPHIIVTREYIEAMGYFVPPIFLHWFIDSWTVQMAKAAGCFTHMKDYLLIHDKPSDAGKGDETHSRIREMGWHDRDKWVAEKCGDWLALQSKKLEQLMDSHSLMHA